MMDQPVLYRLAGAVATPQRHVQRTEHQGGALVGRGGPAHDRAGVHDHGEGDVDDPAPRGHLREVCHPGAVGPPGGEVAVDQVTGTLIAGIRGRGAHRLAAAAGASQTGRAHQPLSMRICS
jgi:hypothetical protein